MAKLAFFAGAVSGLLAGLICGSFAIDDMLSRRVEAGAMVQGNVAYRIVPLEPARAP